MRQSRGNVVSARMQELRYETPLMHGANGSYGWCTNAWRQRTPRMVHDCLVAYGWRLIVALAVNNANSDASLSSFQQ